MKKILENKKGITLVALVVTIIVLIIIASVSINLVLGENGIITKAREAKNNTEIEIEKEGLNLALLSAQMQVDNHKINLENLIRELNNQFDQDSFEVSDNGDGTFSVEFIQSKRVYLVDENGKEETLKDIVMTATPTSNNTPELVQQSKVTIKSPVDLDVEEEQEINISYAWSKSKTEEPKQYSEETLNGSLRKKSVTIASDDTEARKLLFMGKRYN